MAERLDFHEPRPDPSVHWSGHPVGSAEARAADAAATAKGYTVPPQGGGR